MIRHVGKLMNKRIKKEITSWFIVIIVVFALKATFVEAYVIPTPSMEETLLVGDAVLTNRFVYGVKIPIPLLGKQIPMIRGAKPRHGDIVAFLSPFENVNVVKRCIAWAGDTVEIVDKTVYVNGKEMNEPYVISTDERTYRAYACDRTTYQEQWENAELAELFGIHVRDNFGPVVVPDDHIFVMGDNRDVSWDSRYWGPLHTKYLKGKPLFIFFSLNPGDEASGVSDLLKFWRWKGIRLTRIGKLV